MTLANDLTDRQWAAAHVIDQSPIVFDPLAEARKLRNLIAEHLADGLTTQSVFDAADELVADLIELETQREQRRLLEAIAKGEA